MTIVGPSHPLISHKLKTKVEDAALRQSILPGFRRQSTTFPHPPSPPLPGIERTLVVIASSISISLVSSKVPGVWVLQTDGGGGYVTSTYVRTGSPARHPTRTLALILYLDQRGGASSACIYIGTRALCPFSPERDQSTLVRWPLFRGAGVSRILYGGKMNL